MKNLIYADYFCDNGNVVLRAPYCFDPDQVFDCGQCFRFNKSDGIWQGIVGDKLLQVGKNADDVVIYNCTLDEFETRWAYYLGLCDDYQAIRETFDKADSHLAGAMECGKGIRIMHQDTWETCVSFIISQNNNIPKIKNTIRKLCEMFGDKTDFGYTFPSVDRIANADIADLNAIGLGYRAGYLLNFAQIVQNGKLDLKELEKMDTNAVISKLCEVRGIGLKVASCIALFGLGKLDAFPVDVWMRKILDIHYESRNVDFGEYAGIAQQYLFYYERWFKQDN